MVWPALVCFSLSYSAPAPLYVGSNVLYATLLQHYSTTTTYDHDFYIYTYLYLYLYLGSTQRPYNLFCLPNTIQPYSTGLLYSTLRYDILIASTSTITLRYSNIR